MLVKEGKSVFNGVAIGKIFVYRKADKQSARIRWRTLPQRWHVLKRPRKRQCPS